MSAISIKVKGLEALSRKLRALAQGKYLDKVVAASKARLMRRLAQYPPKSPANRPRPAPGRWYERGWGARSAAGRGRRTSQNLGRSWLAQKRGQGFLIRNTASYAPYVMGRKQRALHRRRGWQPAHTLLAGEARRLEGDLIKALEDVIKR